MAGVVIQPDTNESSSMLANVPARQVTSSTRFNWSKHEVSIFESFIRQNHITRSSQKTVDLQPLLASLNLDRFLSIKNTKEEILGPIIETKVRRKLTSVVTSLNQASPASVANLQGTGQVRTRLQAARAGAIAAGKEPPSGLPRPDPIYTPEIWKPRARKPTGASTRTRPKPDTATTVFDTVEKAKEEVIRLEKALTLARARLSQLQQQDQAPGSRPQLSGEQAQQDREALLDDRSSASCDDTTSTRTSVSSGTSSPTENIQTTTKTANLDQHHHHHHRNAPPLTPLSSKMHSYQDTRSTTANDIRPQQQHNKAPLRSRRLNTRNLPPILAERSHDGSGDDSDSIVSAHLRRISEYLVDKYGKDGGKGGNGGRSRLDTDI
jgi:hypothetical protein